MTSARTSYDPDAVDDVDLDLLRRAIALAASARANGNHPFGALVADGHGTVVVTAENTVVTACDPTGHAETNLVRLVGQATAEADRAGLTLYTSTEPCAMCAGAIFWSGIGRMVFGLSGAALIAMTGPADASGPTLALPSRDVLAAGNHRVMVHGPLLDAESAAVHAGFWTAGSPG